LSSRLNQFNCDYQLAPVWSANELDALSSMGLQTRHFFECDGALAALWDQSAFKQTVIRDYAPALAKVRPLANAFAALTGGVRLPAIGKRVRNVYVSHLVTGPDGKGFVELLNLLRSVAGHAGADLLTLAFAADDARLAMARRNFKAREYHSRIYLVHWPDCGAPAENLEHRLIAPEAALL
jgi:hypothetical protein